MASVNKVFLIGNLTRDPELRNLPSVKGGVKMYRCGGVKVYHLG